VLAVTIQLLPDPRTPRIAGVPVIPAVRSTKLRARTRLTGSLKTTVQATDRALVGEAPRRRIETTWGGVVSTRASTRSAGGFCD
jgi:hypothetical protein